MRRLLLILIVGGSLAAELGLFSCGQEDVADVRPKVERPEGATTSATPLPKCREEAAKRDEKDGARLRGRPPPEEPRDLLVVVVDPDGNRVPQARVVLERGTGEDWREWVETLEGGEVRVAGPKGKQTMNLDVTDPEDAEGTPLALLPGRIEGIASGQAEVVVELAWSRRLEGTVRSTDGDPVAGATVRAGPPKRFSAGREAVTDEHGHFEIVGLPSGVLEARLNKNDRWVGPAPVAIEAGEERLDIEVEPLISFAITILDPRGEPVQGVRIRARWSMQGVPQEQSANTDEKGRVLLPSVPRSTELHVFTEWHEGAPAFPDVSQARIPAKDGDVTVHLPEPVALEGTVVDASGRSLDSGRVSATLIVGRGPSPRRPIIAQGRIEAGRFRIGRLARGRYRLTVYAPLANGRAVPIEVEAPRRDVSILLEPVVKVTGRVLDANLQGIIVQWFAAGDWARMTGVADDGTFTIGGVIDSLGTLYVFHRETGACALLDDLSPADAPFEIHLGPGLEIRGRIDDYDPRFEASLRLHAVRGQVRLNTKAKGDGTFVFTGLPAGPWCVILGHPAHPLASLDIEAGQGDVVFPLPPGFPRRDR